MSTWWIHLGLQFGWLQFAKVIKLSVPKQEPSTWSVDIYYMYMYLYARMFSTLKLGSWPLRMTLLYAMQVQASVVKKSLLSFFISTYFFIFYDVSRQIRPQLITFQFNSNKLYTFLISRKLKFILRLFCYIWVIVHIIWCKESRA